MQVFVLTVFLFVFSETKLHYVDLAGLELIMQTRLASDSYRFTSSATQVLRLKACASTPGFVLKYFKKINYACRNHFGEYLTHLTECDIIIFRYAWVSIFIFECWFYYIAPAGHELTTRCGQKAALKLKDMPSYSFPVLELKLCISSSGNMGTILLLFQQTRLRILLLCPRAHRKRSH